MNQRHRWMKFIPFLILFLSVHFALFAQQDFARGYIIKQNRDTVKGFIKTVVEADLYESVFFKTNLNGEWTRYGHSDLLGFGFDNEIFTSVQFLNTSKGNIKDTTFARQLVSGLYNLFTYLNNDGRRFFLLRKDTSINLLYDNLLSNTGEVEQTGNYQNFLNFISIPCDKLKDKYKQVGYDEKSISDFIQATNNCLSGGTSVTYLTKQKVTVTPIIFAGGLSVSRQRSQISANFLVRLTKPGVNKNMSLNIGLNYSNTTYMTSYNSALNPLYRYYTLEQIESIPVTAQYNFTLKRVQPYFYLGVSGAYKTEDNLATGFWVEPNEKGLTASVVGGVGIEARIISGLYLRADWRYELIIQYPAIGLSYHF